MYIIYHHSSSLQLFNSSQSITVYIFIPYMIGTFVLNVLYICCRYAQVLTFVLFWLINIVTLKQRYFPKFSKGFGEDFQTTFVINTVLVPFILIPQVGLRFTLRVWYFIFQNFPRGPVSS